MPKQKFNRRNRLRSFSFAWNGIVIFMRTEHNARIHAFFAIGVVALSWFLEISSTEWIAVTLSIGMVFVSEIINTAIEYICNFTHPNSHPKIKAIKDLAAGGVLLAAVTALVIGLIVFVPKVIVFLSV